MASKCPNRPSLSEEVGTGRSVAAEWIRRMSHVPTCFLLSTRYSLIYTLLSISLFLGRDSRDKRGDGLQHKGSRCPNLVSLPCPIHGSPVPSLTSVVLCRFAIFVPSTDLLHGSGELHLVILLQFLCRPYACTDQDFISGVWSSRIAWPLQPAGNGLP